MNIDSYAVEVLVNGRSVAEHRHDNNTFVEAREGTEYSLRIKNNSWQRVLAVISVDGINAISGQPASGEDRQNGYIIEAHRSIEVKGYRIDHQNVAAFRFADGKLSYAATTADTGPNPGKNNGVIGVRFYPERVHVCTPLIRHNDYRDWDWKYPKYDWTITCGMPVTYTSHPENDLVFKSGATGKTASSSLLRSCSLQTDGPQASVTYSAAPASTPTFDLGTAWGKKVEDHVMEVPFTASDSFTQVVIYYASRAALESYGIDFSNTKKVAAWPEAFGRYCKVPSGYSG
jgi:hypothetical protein